jgi:putative ABC transport system permease protein
VVLPFYAVDYDFLESMGLDLVQGRAFSPDLPTDSLEALVINETAVQQFGWADPLGKRIALSSKQTGTVIGVVKDFHFTSLREAMRPVAFHVRPEEFRYVSARLRPGNVSQVLARLEEIWQQFAPAYPFDYHFLDEDIDALYETEQRLGRAVTYFTGLAVFIACLGLFGLAAFTAERRTKEIGIRKAMGASVPRIVLLISKDFLRLVFVAFVVAAPLAYFALQTWLDNFAYRIEISWGIFLVAGSLSLVVALLTVSYQSIKAALIDPVKSLRYE